MKKSDAKELLRRCAERTDPAAWEELGRRFGPGLRRGAARGLRRAGMRPRREAIDDLLQDTYCRLLDNDADALRRCRGDDEATIGAYLSRIAERIALDDLRRQQADKRGGNKVESLEALSERTWGVEEPSLPPVAEQRLLLEERRRRLVECCRRIATTGGDRAVRVLVLAFFVGLTSREISQRLPGRVTPNSVDTQLHRLRRRLSEQGLTLPRRGFARAASAPSG